MARKPAADVADLPLRVFDIEAHALRPLEQDAPGSRQADSSAGLLEQRRAACFLEPSDCARQGRLRPVKSLGGSAQVLELGDGLEVAQITKLEFMRHDYLSHTLRHWTL